MMCVRAFFLLSAIVCLVCAVKKPHKEHHIFSRCKLSLPNKHPLFATDIPSSTTPLPVQTAIPVNISIVTTKPEIVSPPPAVQVQQEVQYPPLKEGDQPQQEILMFPQQEILMFPHQEFQYRPQQVVQNQPQQVVPNQSQQVVQNQPQQVVQNQPQQEEHHQTHQGVQNQVQQELQYQPQQGVQNQQQQVVQNQQQVMQNQPQQLAQYQPQQEVQSQLQQGEQNQQQVMQNQPQQLVENRPQQEVPYQPQQGVQNQAQQEEQYQPQQEGVQNQLLQDVQYPPPYYQGSIPYNFGPSRYPYHQQQVGPSQKSIGFFDNQKIPMKKQPYRIYIQQPYSFNSPYSYGYYRVPYFYRPKVSNIAHVSNEGGTKS